MNLRSIAAGYISPSPRDVNMTAYATSGAWVNRDDFLAECERTAREYPGSVADMAILTAMLREVYE